MGIRSSSSSSRGTRGSPRSLAVFCCTRFLTVRLPSAPLLRQVESWSGFLAAWKEKGHGQQSLYRRKQHRNMKLLQCNRKVAVESQMEGKKKKQQQQQPWI
ncbi:hypothetical protein MUK42_07548 [Musa troglodytarum]|uniref:Uncharacterized protein n=1 Tax=Musa troglodytarum TaxID=320322 RepID=A0A9E7L7Q4_9LILI|nr:hypothetical protein MUK42_07548 [Musa troglodytarum]URE43581.1 hypothetical protein MUK42_07548 [Musa troglodytarum]